MYLHTSFVCDELMFRQLYCTIFYLVDFTKGGYSCMLLMKAKMTGNITHL